MNTRGSYLYTMLTYGVFSLLFKHCHSYIFGYGMYVWVCFGYVCVCLGMFVFFGHVWVCLGTFGCVWVCLGVFGYIWICLGMFGYVWVCFGYVWVCFGLFGYIWVCLGTLGCVWPCLGVFWVYSCIWVWSSTILVQQLLDHSAISVHKR